MYDSYLLYQHANDKSLLKFRPESAKEFETSTAQLSDDVVAWLNIKDTSVDYPVMQGKNNSEYLNKDPYGNYSLSGSVFLDYRNKADFSDKYNLIYGHHMEEGSMFGALDAYLEEGYLETHQSGTLILNDKNIDIQFFAVIEAPADEKAIFNPSEWNIDYIKDNYLYITNIPKSDHYIALSTCKYPDTIDRTIIIGSF